MVETTADTAGDIQFETRTVPYGGGKTVSAIVARPATVDPQAVVILAHGAGNDMHSVFLSAMHERLAASGRICVKFNFPY